VCREKKFRFEGLDAGWLANNRRASGEYAILYKLRRIGEYVLRGIQKRLMDLRTFALWEIDCLDKGRSFPKEAWAGKRMTSIRVPYHVARETGFQQHLEPHHGILTKQTIQ